MGEKRFISASERSVWILEGALIWGRVQNASGALGAKEHHAAWKRWQANHSIHEQEAAKRLQYAAFDAALAHP
jgi:hypothetical protein